MIERARIKLALKRCIAQVSLGNGSKNAVLFTFDDGPHPESTPVVLSLLKRYKARAIFFVVGARIQRAPHLLTRIRDEGHALGNHSYAHPNERQPRLGAYIKDLVKCQDEIENLTGERPKFFRPPLGRLSFSSMVASKLLGLKTVLWSVDAHDWNLKSEKEASIAAGRLAGHVYAKDIILMHDDHLYTGVILETILPQLADDDYDLYSALDLVR